ncbi:MULTISPECIES: LysE family translocator [unclassified Bradyrhizobium]|uniref:LysE family translocator n=1 Tax=unclassified Bradyrhizobium TaxID=2631580 RepID=UPI0003FC7DB5|nr:MULTISPECIES: LysE family transporter [unclassified Bradyrhizobium]MCP3464589.1 LysE family transporter [Bradyrhizobium sp. CCGUVB23]
MDVVPFVAAAASLLAIPGPTNTLLATSGASVGWSRSLHLLAAELAGYLLAILILRALLAPLMIAVPMVGTALRVVVALYLVHLAVLLWRHGASDFGSHAPVTFQRVLITTLLNPKAIIFASALLPFEVGACDLMPRLALLAAQIATIGSAWIALGVSLGCGFDGIGRPALVYKLSAIAQVILAGMIGTHSLGIA